jgi:hypothetical protein
MDILFWYILLTYFNNHKMFFLTETIISIKNHVFAKTNKRYINKKIILIKN